MGQFDTFMNLLIRKTEEGRVEWTETDYEDTYEAEFSNSRLRLTPFQGPPGTTVPYSNYLENLRRNSNSYSTLDIPIVLEIRDSFDEIIETVGVTNLDEAYFNTHVFNAITSNSAIRALREFEDRAVAPSLRRLHRAIRRQLVLSSEVIDGLINELEEK